MEITVTSLKFFAAALIKVKPPTSIYSINSLNFILSLSFFLYQSALNQNNEIEEFIVVELDTGNLIQQMYCVVMIDNQCEVRDVKYGGISIEELDEMIDRMDNTKAMSRVSFVTGIFLTLFSIKKELLKIKGYLWD